LLCHNRLDRIVDPEKKQAAMTFARTVNMALLPAAVLVFAVVSGVKRRKKTQAPPACQQV
jgi:hypothetical protein